MSDLRLKLRNVLFTVLNKIDNNNNDQRLSNGEEHLLQSVVNNFREDNFVLYDVGANVGDFTSTTLKLFRQIHKGKKEISAHAFEPLPLTFAKLKHNLENEHACRLVNKAVSEKEGTAKIYYDQNELGLTSLHQRNGVSLPVEATVELVRLDNYIKESGVGCIHFLKLDTEGHELSALKSTGDYLHPQFIKTIQFEYGGTYLDSRTYLKDMYDLLIPKGYEIYKIYARSIKKREYHPAMETFQYSNFVAIGKPLK